MALTLAPIILLLVIGTQRSLFLETAHRWADNCSCRRGGGGGSHLTKKFADSD